METIVKTSGTFGNFTEQAPATTPEATPPADTSAATPPTTETTQQTAAPATEAQTTPESVLTTPEAAPPAADAPPAATPEDEAAVFTFGGDAPPATPEQPGTPEATTPAVAQPLNWKEAIKAADRKEILKELGVSDFALELNEHIAKGGNAADYINAKAVDYNAVSDIDLIRQSIKEESPFATERQIELLIANKYHQGEFADEDQKELGNLILKTDANKIRQRKIEEQAKFKIPETSVQGDAMLAQIQAQVQQYEAEEQAAAEQTRQFFLTHPANKSLLESKRVAVSVGDGKVFNFPVGNPEVMVNIMTDATQWSKLLTNEKGEPDVQKMQRVVMAASNPNYERDLVNFGIAQGKKALIEEGQNAGRPNTQIPSSTQTQAAVIVNKDGRGFPGTRR
jgi:hypothetical protein